MPKIEFSLIIPAANDRKVEVVRSINWLEYPKENFEVIVERGPNPSENRNNGIRKSSGSILVFLDDDAVLPKELLKNAKSFFQQHPDAEIVGGPQLTPQDDSFFQKMSGYALSSFFGAFSMSKRYKKTAINLNTDETNLTSAICLIKPSVFDRIGGFNPDLFPGEDPEFFARAKKNGIKIAYSPEIYIYHRRRSTYKLFFKQIFNYGISRIKKEKTSRTKTKPVFLVPSIFVIYLIILPFLSFLSPFFIIPLIIYIVLAIAFSIPSILKNPLGIFIMPILFFTMHIAYGLGVIKGFSER